MVNATLAVAAAISTEATLSFLGLGVQPPQNSWGRMLAGRRGRTRRRPRKFYLVLFPGLMLLLTVLAVNFLGDGLRDAFDPQVAALMVGRAGALGSQSRRSTSRPTTASCTRSTT